MARKNLQNEQLDRIARNLLDATRMPPDEIERIIAAPTLFESVKSKIESEKIKRQTEKTNGWIFFVSGWRIAGATFAAFAVLALTAFGLIQLQKPFQTEQFAASVPEIKSRTYEFLPPVSDPTSAELKTEKINYTEQKTPAGKTAEKEKPVRKTKSSNKPHGVRKETVSEFYALTYTGNSTEAEENLHIVRVELPRSSLFALGVNVQLENEPGKIKTDLLVGSDGVTRAIRFVK